jgi:hypothetical protein
MLHSLGNSVSEANTSHCGGQGGLSSRNAAHWVMDITQLLITAGAIVGIILIGLLAVIPALLDRPGGRDQAEPDRTAPAPPPADRRPKNGVDLAA